MPKARIVLLSVLDGCLLGAGAGALHGLGVALVAGILEPNSGFAGLVLLAVLVAVPAGVVLGAVFGTGFGFVAWTGVRHLVWLETSVVAAIGAIVLAAAVTGAPEITGGVLAWTGGPLLLGTPAAALHGRRAQRRSGAR